MNTADRSIALIDTALRRRFSFVEMQPEPELRQGGFVGESRIDIARLLRTMNKRISVLLNRDHAIGHSYFLPLKDDPSLDKLADIFEHRIVPLLQEYFYDDYEKIQLVLGDNQKEDDAARFVVRKADTAELFGDADLNSAEYYEINRAAFKREEAYAYF